MRVRVLFEPRDIWIGVYWDREIANVGGPARKNWVHIYVCILPMLPIHITIYRRGTHPDRFSSQKKGR